MEVKEKRREEGHVRMYSLCLLVLVLPLKRGECVENEQEWKKNMKKRKIL